MKLVIPMAGRGSRFRTRNVETPKPLVEIAGRPMIAWALDSLAAVPRRQTIFVALAEHERLFGVTRLLQGLVAEAASVVLLEDVTEGQLCTVLAARDWIETEEDILIASSDTYVTSRLGEDIANRPPDCRGIISVADVAGDRWSFAKTDVAGRVVQVAEKVRISDHASTGLYYFANGAEFVAAAGEMIRRREKTCGEYYVMPVYQEYVRRGWRVDISQADVMWDMGTPEAAAQAEAMLLERRMKMGQAPNLLFGASPIFVGGEVMA